MDAQEPVNDKRTTLGGFGQHAWLHAGRNGANR